MMIRKRMAAIYKAAFAILMIPSIFGIADAGYGTQLNSYNIQFDLPEGYTIQSDHNVPEYIQKNIGLADKNGNYYSLFMIITENLIPRVIDDQTKVHILNGFLINKFELDPNKPNINNKFCDCGKSTNGALNSSVKAEPSDQSDLNYFAFLFYLTEDNSSHIIVWTNSEPIADHTCDSLLVSLHSDRRSNL